MPGMQLLDRARQLVTWADTAVGPYRVGLLFLAVALMANPGMAVAQEATPAPDVPPPSLCTVEAPSFERLNAIVLAPSTPEVAATPVPARTPGLVPAGTPADAATVAGLTATVRELVGCYNAGEPLRAYGLFTEPYLRRVFARQGGWSRAVYDSYATPQPEDPARYTKILEIGDVRLLEDGTAGATVTMRYASIPVNKTFFFVFTWTGERWLIADIVGEINFSVP